MPDDLRPTTEDTQTEHRDDLRPSGRKLDEWQKDAASKAKQGHAETDGKDEADEADDGDRPKSKKPSIIRRHPFWILFGLLAIAAIAVAGYFVWLVYFYPYESTDDAFVDSRQFSVAAKVSGYIIDVPVTDNQHVEPGDVIMRIDPRDYQIALDQADTQVESAKAGIQNSDAQIAASQATVEQAKARVASAQAALQFAQDEAGRQDALVKSGAGTLQAAQQARSNLLQSQGSFQEAQAELASAIKNVASAQAQKASTVATLHQAEAQVEEAQQNVYYTTLYAAQPGQVVRLTGAKGQFIDAGQSVAMFVPDEKWITANFKETQITDMRPGQAVSVEIDAYPDHVLKGKVASVQPGSGTAFSLLPAENATGNYVKVTQRVPVKITVDQWPSDVTIGPGMSVVPTVTVHPRD